MFYEEIEMTRPLTGPGQHLRDYDNLIRQGAAGLGDVEGAHSQPIGRTGLRHVIYSDGSCGIHDGSGAVVSPREVVETIRASRRSSGPR